MESARKLEDNLVSWKRGRRRKRNSDEIDLKFNLITFNVSIT